MDGFGVLVLASATAIGGGTTRDLILGLPVFWTHDPVYLYTIIVAALLTIIWLRFRAYIPMNTLMVADAIGLSFLRLWARRKLYQRVSALYRYHHGHYIGLFWRHAA